MNGIVVPSAFKHMTKRERNGREYNEAAIKDYIIAHEGQVLSVKDFTLALDGLTTAGLIVSRLRKQGKITRHAVKNGQHGHAFTYKVVQGNSVPLTIKQTNGEVITKPRTVFATALELKSLDRWFLAYCDNHSLSVPDVNKFRRYVHQKAKDNDGV